MHKVTRVDYTVSAYEKIAKNGNPRIIALNILDSRRANKEITDIIMEDDVQENWGVLEGDSKNGQVLMDANARGLALYHIKYNPEHEPRIGNLDRYQTERIAGAGIISVCMSWAIPRFTEIDTFPLYTERPLTLSEYQKFIMKFFQSLVFEHAKRMESSPSPTLNKPIT